MDRARLGSLLPAFATGYVVLNLLHVADHVRQGRALAPQVSGPGTAVLFVAVILAALAWRRSRLAPYLGLAFGAVTSVGLVIVHLIPPWGAYSDSYLPLQLDALSYLSVLSLLAAGPAIGISSAVALSGTRGPQAQTSVR
ncbi:MAG TPA: hypothetical protein VGR61_04070 [Candidatus Dormibacteraeota bacterium]|nr:hypothetical protein [Candidatus Dormibacteraeota bacterium]